MFVYIYIYIYIRVRVDIQTLFAKVSTGFNIPNQHLYPWDHRGTVNGAIDSFDKAELVLFNGHGADSLEVPAI